jgi:threonine aldolase
VSTRPLDLRSDTVTQPTDRMRAAMAAAEVGDDVFGEDPTVQELERRGAELLGKEAGVFLASGTMANQIAVLCLSGRGRAAVVLEHSHLHRMERAGGAALMGVPFLPIPSDVGVIDNEQLEAGLARVAPIQMPKLGVLCLENTYDLNRGLVVGPEQTDAMVEVGRKLGLPTFLDGARIFNAAVALNRAADEFTRAVDAAQFCLSKGLSSPVGSILVGDKAFVDEARWWKQQFGGGWRQAGSIAAAGLVGLEDGIDRLAEDHQKAADLGKLLAEAGLVVDPTQIQTNIVRASVAHLGLSEHEFVARMASRSVLVKPIGPSAVRLVVHREISDADLQVIASTARACAND